MSQVLKNTYYGPVALKTTTGTTQINNQTQGSLLDAVQLPTDDSPSLTEKGTYTYTEKWKAPYSYVKNIIKNTHINLSLAEFHAILQNAIPGSLVSRFNEPTLNSPSYWGISSLRVRELEAGDHCIIEVKYNCVDFVPSEGGAPSYQRTGVEWNLKWQSYTVSPYAFCKNDLCADPPAGDPPSETGTANRYNIEQYLQNYKASGITWDYQANDGVMRTLNKSEGEVFKKICQGKNALYHYPLIEKITIDNWTKNISSTVELSSITPKDGKVDKIDYIGSPANCPYSFEEDYEWVKVDDSYTLKLDINNLQFTRHEAWMGVISADRNFYGNKPDRWEIGQK